MCHATIHVSRNCVMHTRQKLLMQSIRRARGAEGLWPRGAARDLVVFACTTLDLITLSYIFDYTTLFGDFADVTLPYLGISGQWSDPVGMRQRRNPRAPAKLTEWRTALRAFD